MNNKEFSILLETRTRKFAVNTIKLSSSLPNTPEGRVVKNQLSKSATSIGANYSEANRARSKPDFKNKIKICESEASETIYWLSIIHDLKWGEYHLFSSIKSEAKQLLAIFTTISQQLKL